MLVNNDELFLDSGNCRRAKVCKETQWTEWAPQLQTGKCMNLKRSRDFVPIHDYVQQKDNCVGIQALCHPRIDITWKFCEYRG